MKLELPVTISPTVYRKLSEVEVKKSGSRVNSKEPDHTYPDQAALEAGIITRSTPTFPLLPPPLFFSKLI